MKIALVVPGGVDRSGTRRVIPIILWLIERLVRAGDEVHVFALNQEAEPGEWHLLGATVHNAGRRPRRFRALSVILGEHRRSRFDIVHAFWAGAPGQVACAFRLISGVPAVVTLPGGDLTAIPKIGYGAQLRWRSRVATRFVLSGASAIIAPSEWLAKEARAQGFEPILCPFGVALDQWPPSEPRPRRPGAPIRLLHVASLNRVKDPFTLLDAMRHLADQGVDFTLDMIGEDILDGAVQASLRRAFAGRPGDIRGFLETPHLRPKFERSDLLTMSSLHEGALMVMLEAAVAGVPTVGTKVGYIADWAPEAAVAVPLSDPVALARVIADLSADDEKRLRIARSAHARAIQRDADAYVTQVRSIHADLVRRGEVSNADELPARGTDTNGARSVLGERGRVAGRWI